MPKARSSPIDAHIGYKLRAQRMALGLSQTQLGAPVGITFQQVQKFEKGQNRIAAGQLFQFAQFLGVPISYFYEGLLSNDGDPAHAAEHVQELIKFVGTPEGARLCSAFSRISDATTRKKIIELVRALSESVFPPQS